ncbi:beta-fructofuranosidase, insoluble isoenzyme CWINV5 isoform X1 [Eutrema salsugineum]|uniref:beta-fructofuranosidase, insoluble isoenzyme CWINV5 isoform X1 n=1 Tax=Eutrema salsugineum TaxID=72664 RepID=UPI000CECF914|nr:beta-fructofuranosidase, insoluble isoenzyme CWINV5 isoform X1 [Eutrema salsugineum]
MTNIVWCNIAIFLLASLFLTDNALVLEALHHAPNRIKDQPYRTGYHFQPPKNWMNDPNGPMIYKGIYHLFYQWYPNGVVTDFNKIVWGHATSTDLINWTPHSPAIKPSRPSDINGCWSGSVTILPNGKPVILYTGNDRNNHQVQNLARPKNLSDPYLRHWTKSPANPLVTPNAVNHINSTAFRDPTTAWLGRNGRWRVITGSQEGRRGLALLHTSRDFTSWKQSTKPLHYNDGTGMWECPDFFPVARFNPQGLDTSSFGESIKHVLKVSLSETSHDYYTIGTYDRMRDVYVPDDGFVQDGTAPRYDYGKFYASKTFYDSVYRRRILWGWVNESSPVKDNVDKGWAGLQAIPRKVWLDESGKRLMLWPVKEIERLRAKQVKLENKVLEGGGSVLDVHGVTASQADVEVFFKVTGLEEADVIEPGWTDPQLICSQNKTASSGLGPFGLMVLASKNLEEYTSVYLRIFKARQNSKDHVVVMCSDQSRSSLEKGNDKTPFGAFLDISPYQPISLRTLIDNSIVESFVGKGKTCITSRVYPKLAIGKNAHLFAFNNGSQNVDVLSLSAWSMKSSL